MVRKRRKDGKLVALILDSYDPKTDRILYVTPSSRKEITGAYHSMRNRSTLFHVTEGSPEELRFTQLLSHGGFEPVYVERFSNPVRKAMFSKL